MDKMKSQILNSLNIMLDLETIGKNPNAIIIQLAAVPFTFDQNQNLEVKKNFFNESIDPRSSKKYGLTAMGESGGQSTLDFWLTQEKEVFEKVVIKAMTEGRELRPVLEDFREYLSKELKASGKKDIILWGNGPSADCTWLKSSYIAIGESNSFPWNFWMERCVRTIVETGSIISGKDIKKETVFVGDKHDAVCDCLHQIEMIKESLKYICFQNNPN